MLSPATWPLEKLMTSSFGFGLATATPLQRAIWRIADGLPLGALAAHPDVVAAIGDCSRLTGKPRELVVLSAIRTGKSLTAAGMALRWSQTCDVSRLGAGETPRVSVVSTTKDLADVTFSHVVGNILARPSLKRLLVDEPTTDTVTVRHPSDRPVEVKVVAGSRAGTSLVARWSAGAIFDEAPRMVGADEGVINYDDARAAVVGRLLPGAQIASIGSPWAPFGPIYETFVTSWQRPSNDAVVIKAPGWVMNPTWWTPERVAALKASDPDVYATDCAAEFASPEEALFTAIEVERATRQLPFERSAEADHEYTAAMDPATRGNAWTLVVSTRVGARKIVCLAREWKGSRLEPLSPRDVLQQIAEVLRPYRVRGVHSDQWSGDAIRDLAREQGLQLWEAHLTETEKTQAYMTIRTKLAQGEIELPPEPMLRSDLLRVKKRTTQNGVQIVLPKTGDGRHCDYAPALLLALRAYLDDVAPPPPTENEAMKKELARMRDAASRKYGPPRRRR
jgi:hypothetical protein